jgi:transposase-like protein
MKAMARHRSHSIEFKRQVAQEFIAGETLHGLAARHGVSRNLIRVWVVKFEAGASAGRQASLTETRRVQAGQLAQNKADYGTDADFESALRKVSAVCVPLFVRVVIPVNRPTRRP